MSIKKPGCYADEEVFQPGTRRCDNCPWLLPCGTQLDHEFPIPRQRFIKTLLLEGHPPYDKETISAVAKQYYISKPAAKMSIRRVRRKIDLERVKHD